MQNTRIGELARQLRKELELSESDLVNENQPEFLPDLIRNLEELAAGHGSSHQDNHNSSPD